EEGAHLGGLHLPQVGHARGGEGVEVTCQIPAVRGEGVPGQPALHGQVVQVCADCPVQPFAQRRTSSGGTAVRPWAAATAALVITPAWVFKPAASPGSRRIASRQPWPASSSTYGTVTLVSA